MSKTHPPIRVAVIMAGGSGERFWPLSNPNHPKQFLQLTHEKKSLLEQAVSHIKPLFDKENIFLATGKHLVDACRQADTGIPDRNIIAEPFKRNTAGCLALAAAELLARYGGAKNILMGVFPADHNILQPKAYQATVKAALAIAEREDALVTIGITPTRPETGYGYIRISDEDSFSEDGVLAHPVIRFTEKPGFETAKEYVESGRFYWNSGMFFWRLSVFMNELRHASPGIASVIDDMHNAIKADERARLASIFENLDNISIDYALMEKAKRVLALEAGFGWDDIGAWDALLRQRKADRSGNVIVGNPVVIDTRNSIVYNDSENIDVGVIGLENIAVIITEHGVLVAPKERAQDVKRIVEELKRRGKM